MSRTREVYEGECSCGRRFEAPNEIGDRGMIAWPGCHQQLSVDWRPSDEPTRAGQHAALHEWLRVLRAHWRELPEQRAHLEWEISVTSIQMLALRDQERIARGINPTAGDGNPFGGGIDF